MVERRNPPDEVDLFGQSAPASHAGGGGASAHSVRPPPNQPLADRLRPQKLEDVVGQGHLLGPDGSLTRML
ncbi:MAG: replication-associated recombination protein A, partial [Acetobacter cibinongensis]